MAKSSARAISAFPSTTSENESHKNAETLVTKMRRSVLDQLVICKARFPLSKSETVRSPVDQCASVDHDKFKSPILVEVKFKIGVETRQIRDL